MQHKSTMKAAHFSLFIFLLSFTEQTTAQRDACPSWSISVNSSSTTCYCNNSLSGVKCFPILCVGNCMTYNSSTVRGFPYVALQVLLVLQRRRKMFLIRGAGLLNVLREAQMCGRSPNWLGGSGGMPPGNFLKN